MEDILGEMSHLRKLDSNAEDITKKSKRDLLNRRPAGEKEKSHLVGCNARKGSVRS